KVYPVPERSVSLSGIYPRSIVLDYFLRGKKKFSDLNFK
ncbi:MAG TPA: glycosyl transferase family 2, partial [Butyricimonas virosa]|nr:glycosyl transferase family 2 [Butyricimonas virosa]